MVVGIHRGGHRKMTSSVFTDEESIQRNGRAIQAAPKRRHACATRRTPTAPQRPRRTPTIVPALAGANALEAIVDPLLRSAELDHREQEEKRKEHPADRRGVAHLQLLEGRKV